MKSKEYKHCWFYLAMLHSYLVSVSDISAYLFCPRKIFYRIVHKRLEPQNAGALRGSILHEAARLAIENETKNLQKLGKPEEEPYKETFQASLKEVLNSKSQLMENLNINKEECFRDLKIMTDAIARDRFTKILQLVESGLRGVEIVNSIEPKLHPEMWFDSKSVGLKGKVDCLELWKDKVVPVDFKTSDIKGDYQMGDILQVTGYLMLLKNHYRKTPVPYGILKYLKSGKEIVVEETAENKEKVNEIAGKIREMVSAKKEPEPCNNRGCSVCAGK